MDELSSFCDFYEEDFSKDDFDSRLKCSKPSL